MLVPAPTRVSVAAQTSTGTDGTTSCDAASVSTLPSEDFASTVQSSFDTPAGAGRFHVTGTAPPAGMVTVNGLPTATDGLTLTVAVTCIGLSDPLRRVKLAP